MSAEITTWWVSTSKVILLCFLQRLRVQSSRCRREIHAVFLSSFCLHTLLSLTHTCMFYHSTIQLALLLQTHTNTHTHARSTHTHAHIHTHAHMYRDILSFFL